MRSYKDITNKYFKYNKKRSVLTICGVILSVALITSVALFLICMQNEFVQDEMRSKGSFHISMKNSSEKDYEKIRNNPKIDKIGLRETLDVIPLKGNKNIKMDKFNKDALELLTYRTVEGNLPKEEGEIALEGWVLNYLDKSPKLGDKIELVLKNNEIKEFKVTGLIKNEIENQYEGNALGIIYSEKFDISKSNMYITISKECDISDTIKELKNTFKNISSNEDVLRVLGEGEDKRINKNLYSIAIIVITIVIIATIAVIYNSFQISVVERIKQYGLLKAVGATAKQIRKIVLREATIIGLIGIPLGLLSGVFAVFVVIMIFRKMSSWTFGTINFAVSWYVLIISAIVGVISIYVSALIPSRFASNISPLTAISSRNFITKEKVNKRRGKIAKRFLNINILMAFKNIKRNKKRFNITVFSMAISIVLFIVFRSYINMMGNFTGKEIENFKTHFMLEGLIDKEGKSSLNQSTLSQIRDNELVKGVIESYGTYASKALLTDDQKDKEAENVEKDIFTKTRFDDKEINSVNIICDIYNETKINNTVSYITSGKIDKEKIIEDNGVVLVKNNLLVGNGKKYVGPISNLKVGDSFFINKNFIRKNVFDNIEKNIKMKEDNTCYDKNNTVKVKIVAMVDSAPYLDLPSANMYTKPQYLKLIIPKEVMKNIYNKDIESIPLTNADIILKDENSEKEFERWLQPLGDSKGIKVINTLKAFKEAKNSIVQIKILLYGFIAVIALIGCVNVINTITTNLLLRRKEIASLSALGMTYKNIRTMIFSEGMLYGLYGILYGGVIGSLFAYLLSLPMRNLLGFKWGIPWDAILISGVVTMIVSLVAIIRPLNLIRKENTIELIREEG